MSGEIVNGNINTRHFKRISSIFKLIIELGVTYELTEIKEKGRRQTRCHEFQ
jgi:hypothetical protein